MTANAISYPQYKNITNQWFDKIPSHWAECRLRDAVNLIVSNVDKHSKDEEIQVRLCNYVDVYKNERITSKIPFMTATARDEEIEHYRLQENDVVITKDSESWTDIGVPSLVQYTASDLICGYHLAILRPKEEVILGNYLNYLLKSKNVRTQFHLSANGITRYGLSHLAIKNVALVLPPISEQILIVKYLDHVDRRIKQYIRAKQKLIKLLNEQKQAIIQHVVTKGLNPEVQLKSSGIDFVGDIPEHWNVVMNQRIFKEVIRPHGGKPETQLSLSQRDGLIATAQMNERSLQTSTYENWKVTLPGDLVLNRFKAHLGVFFASTLRGIVSFHYGVFSPRDKLVTKYYELLFHTTPYKTIYAGRSNGMTVGLQNLSNQNFYNVKSIVPPVDEQQAIVSYLEKTTESLNMAIDQTQTEVDLVKEYHTRLVSDIVTGKLDVRSSAMQLTEAMDEKEFGEEGELLDEDEELYDEETTILEGQI